MPSEPVPPSVESIFNTVIDAIIAIDENGIMQSANPAVEKIFGYTAAELIGKNVSMLMPSPYASEHDGYLRNYLKTGQAKIIGIGREVVAKRKDNTTFPAYLGVSEGRKEGNRRFFTGVIRDITEMKRYQDDLKKQGEFTAAVLNTVQSLVMVLDREGRIVNFNQACEETTGYPFQQVVGKPFWDFFLTMEDREPVKRHFLSADAARRVNHFETIWLTRKGEKRLVAWSNSVLVNDKNQPEFIIGTGIDITERRRLEQMVLEIARKEQQRLGQELHDGIAQHLVTTAIMAKVAEQKLDRQGSPAAKDVKVVVDMVNQAVAQTRELAQGLYALEMQADDLFTSIRKLTNETEKTLKIKCKVEIEEGLSVPSEMAPHLYRIAREAVGNAVKHGRCRLIQISLKKKDPGRAELRIENDGKKFVQNSKAGGLGMRIMRSRATLIQASLDVGAAGKKGAVVSCVFGVPE